MCGFLYKKGYNFERNLKLDLENKGWKVIRSGGSKKPDIVAARKGEILIIECKVTKNSNVYLDEKEVQNLKNTAKEFNGKGLYAIKQKQKKYVFIELYRLKKVGKMYIVKLN